MSGKHRGLSREGALVGSRPATVPYDPKNPPKAVVYDPLPGRPMRQCHCHGRTLERGEPVLLVPRTDVEGAVFIFCRDSDAYPLENS